MDEEKSEGGRGRSSSGRAKKRGPLPKKVREGLNHRKSEKPEALEKGKKRCRDEN